MRDHPFHIDPIQAGMWGLRFDKEKHKILIKKFWNKLVDPKMAKIYNPHNYRFKGIFYVLIIYLLDLINFFFKDIDQIWLKSIIWNEVNHHALIHDSFHCEKNMSGIPWPTQRLGDCFVGSCGNCNTNATNQFFKCPNACRPKEHQDWTNC